MRILEIQNRVDTIRRVAAEGDFEQAHSLEDALLVDALQAISDMVGSPSVAMDAPALAAGVLVCRDVEFARVMA